MKGEKYFDVTRTVKINTKVDDAHVHFDINGQRRALDDMIRIHCVNERCHARARWADEILQQR